MIEPKNKRPMDPFRSLSPKSWGILAFLGFLFYLAGIADWSDVLYAIIAIGVVWSIYDYEINFLLLMFTLHVTGTLDQRWFDVTDKGRWIFLFLFVLRAFLPLFRRTKPMRYTLIHYLLIAYSVIALLTVIDSFIFSISLYRTISLWWLLLAIGFAIWRYMDSKAKLIRWLKIAVIVANVFLVLNLFAQDWRATAIGFGRFKGVYLNPNLLGLVMFFHVPICFYLYKFEKYRNVSVWARNFYLASFSLSVFELILSGSRASIGGVLAGGMVAAAFYYRGRIAIMIVAAMLIVGPVYFYAISFFESEFFQKVVVREDTAEQLGGREAIWRHSIEFFKKYPMMGWGFGNSDYVIALNGKRERYNPERRWGLHTHSSYLRVMVETGLVGTFIYSIFLLAVPIKILRFELMVKSRELNRLMLALVAVFTGGLLNSFLESWMFSVGSIVAFEFWFIAFAIYKVDLEKTKYT